MRLGTLLCLVATFVLGESSLGLGPFEKLTATVEREEDVYTYEHTENGAGPMWCNGNTSIVRVEDEVFASGVEAIPGAKPLNNCLPFLLHQTQDGWNRIFQGTRRTREPSPLTMFHDGQVFLSANPTLTPPDTYNGPSRPGVLKFQMASPEEAPLSVEPVWEGKPAFTEHSYRSFAADGERGELILLHNVGYTHAAWSYRDSDARWSVQGKLVWPWGEEYDRPQPIRLCYPAVALKDRRVFFCGVSDIVEPNQVWRDYKLEISGRDWDYVFRRLYFTWSDDITTGEFHDWVDIANREETAGHMSVCDLYVAPNEDVFVLWYEAALEERLRAKFFSDAKQRYALESAVLRDGKVVHRSTLVEAGDGLGGAISGKGRFHVTEEGRLFVVYYQGGVNHYARHLSENRLVELDEQGKPSKPITIPLDRPFKYFFTTTVRAGCRPSNVLDLFGLVGKTMRYARVRIK